MRKSPGKRAQVSFFGNYLLFPRDHAITHTLRFSDRICLKKALNTFTLFFLLSTSFSYPRNTSQSSFPVNLRQKLVKKLPQEEKVFLFSFYNFFPHTPSHLTAKNNTTYFCHPFYHRKLLNRLKKRKLNFFFSFLFLPFFAPRSSCLKEITFFSEIPT